jgi:DNA-directed RNA polymerase III subunit RPC6
MKSVEHPTRKMYIKSSLSPSERATGGPWYTDGELDEPFVEHVIEILYHRIKERTFYQSSSYSARKPKKIVKKMTPEEAKAARAKGLGPRAGKEEVEDERAVKRRRYESMLPMPAGYQGYPTLNELTLYVENGQYVSQTLTSNDIQQLLDILIFDDRIEKVFAGADGVSYQALRKSLKDPDESATVLSEAPCGRCPVFDLCEEGGPVAPSNCEYFNDWLAI